MEQAPSSKNISRRLVTTGTAWAVPAIALTAAAPAFAASPSCFPLTWTTTGDTALKPQNVTVSGQNSGAPRTETVTVTPSLTSGYNLPGGTAYTPLNLTSTNGSVALSTWVSPSTTGTQRTGGYLSLTVPMPAGTLGPLSFTISGIDSYTATANANGAQYFTDKIEVLNNGVAVVPSSSSGVTVNGGVVTGSGSSAGWASYTLQSPGTIEIRLGNAFTGTIPTDGHPNQTVTLSSFVCSATPPAPQQPVQPTCQPTLTGYSLEDRYGNTVKTLTQFETDFKVEGLPPGSTLVSASVTFYTEKWDGTRGWGSPYDPRTTGYCTSASQCTWTAPNYPDTSGVAMRPDGQYSTVAKMWNPDFGATITAVDNAGTQRFYDYNTQQNYNKPAWSVTFQANVANAPALVAASNGCLGMTVSGATPALYFVWDDPKDRPISNTYNSYVATAYSAIERRITYRTPDGQTHDLTKYVAGRVPW